jgi:hypothetical protein
MEISSEILCVIVDAVQESQKKHREFENTRIDPKEQEKGQPFPSLSNRAIMDLS